MISLKKFIVLNTIGLFCISCAIHFFLLDKYLFPLNTAAYLDILLNSMAYVMLSILLIVIFNFYNPTKKYIINRVLIILATTFSYYLIISLLNYYILLNFSNLHLFINQTLYLRIAFAFIYFCSISIITWIYTTSLYNYKNQEHVNNAEKVMREAELLNLKQQLQPHFLFNSLNSINALTIINPIAAREMVNKLADFLRLTLQKDTNQFIPLAEEITLLNLYLDIEKVRFGDRLNFTINSNENLSKFIITHHILQPLLENAIKYSLYGFEENVTINIDIQRLKNMLEICITNPFDPNNLSTAQGENFGLNYMKRKLYLIYGRNDLLQIQKTESKFIATLQLPIIN